MKPKLTTRILKYLLITSAAIAVATVLIWIILQGYSAPWTGFADFTKPDPHIVRGKTLWDWMQLFIIPIFLSVGVFLLNRSERKNETQRAEERTKLEREIATDRQQETALQSYLDRMADLLLKEKLRTTEVEEARDVARMRTLTILRGLDSRRKGMVLLFLQEAGLIAHNPVINLTGANLTDAYLTGARLDGAVLRGADLTEAKLFGAFMPGVNLVGAHLTKADLTLANLMSVDLTLAHLTDAHLKRANLSKAILVDTDLRNADLTKAELTGADLTEASLHKAIVSEEQLATAKSLKGTIMPDGTKHD